MSHTIVVDLGYGDAGKGRVVDLLCAEPGVEAVVRFNGGAQAAHNVVLPDGRHHTFAQFGAGTFRGVPTHLSRFVVVDPLALAAEAAHLVTVGVPDPFALLTVDEDALLATPWHAAANRVRERRRGAARHGSCGLGVGETVAYALAHPGDAPRVGDVFHPARLRQRLAAVRDRLTAAVGPLPAPDVDAVLAVFAAFRDAVRIVGPGFLGDALRRGPCVFEGAQGVLLDEWFGWHPHTTWSTTTFANALELLAGAPARRLGVVRTYTTRHGAGPLVTEDPSLRLPEPHNGTGEWQGAFRRGHFDAPAHRYAVEVCGGVDALAVTHLDVPPEVEICTSYRELDRIPVGRRGDLEAQERLTAALLRTSVGERYRPDDWPAAVESELGVPVVLGTDSPRGAPAFSRDTITA
ncbi:adenylosuccinate synthetase [Cryptosporangium japonicum]|uniref:Adenylosuccinate synthetase n=1 Tax=Cryptosporangium japonicum TaxID=80872 RepID=A0ABP3EP30_9ACTN